jgi:cysteine desulfurase
VLEEARVRVATLAEVKPDAVIATGSATEANALGIVGYGNALIQGGVLPADIHVLYDAGAHRSLIGAVEELKALGVRTEALVYTNGAIDMKQLRTQVQPDTRLVAVSAVCGETGAITPVRDVRRAVGTQAVLHVDASQLPRIAPFELTRLGADMLVLDAQKVGGVRGVGVLIAPRRVPLRPLYVGGGQERALRPGTPSPALLSAFAEALEEAHETRPAFCAHATQLRARLVAVAQSIEQMVVNEGDEQAPHIVNLSLLGRDTDYLVALLDREGFAVSTKSACEQNGEGSRPVLQMTGSVERAHSTLRISFSPQTRVREVDAFCRALIRCVNFLDTTDILKA